MTSALNYQTPAGYANDNIWAQGKKVFAKDGANFPPRCIQCNSPDTLKWKLRSLTWAPPYLYLVLLVGLIPAIIILMIFQRKAKIQTASCAACRKKLLTQRLIAWGIFLAAIASFAAAIGLENGYLALLGVVLIFAALIYGVVMGRAFTITRIEKSVVTLKGLGPHFVASLNQQAITP